MSDAATPRSWRAAWRAAAGAVVLAGCMAGGLSLRADLEQGALDARWLAEAPFPYSLQTVAEDGTGNHVLRFEWRQADVDGTRRTLGSELKSSPMGARRHILVEFDIYIADNLLPASSGPVVLMQLHSVPDLALGEQWRAPVTSLYFQGGRLLYTWRASSEAVTPGRPKQWKYSHADAIPLGEPRRNAWNHIRLEHRLDHEGSGGFVAVEFNGVRHEKAGTRVGFNDASGPYLKLGIYCPGSMPQPRLVTYVDNILLQAR